MDLREFKSLIRKEFGPGLRNATPGNVREFLDRMELNPFGGELNGRVLLDEQASTYEEILKDFFMKVLDLPRDEALITLWLLAFDFAFSAIELQHDDKLKALFREFDGLDLD